MSVSAPGSDVWKSSRLWQSERRYLEIVSGDYPWKAKVCLSQMGLTSKTMEGQDSGPKIEMAGKGMGQKMQNESKKPEALSQATQQLIHHKRPAALDSSQAYPHTVCLALLAKQHHGKAAWATEERVVR